MTQDEVIALAREADLSIRGHYDETGSTPAEIVRFAKMVEAKASAAERKACLQIADDCADAAMHASMVANAIRARGTA